MAERRGYLLIALMGLVIAGLLSALAAYLSFLLIWVLVEKLISPGYAAGGLWIIAPVYLAAAVMPLWGIRVFWSVLARPADPGALRRSAVRLLRWSCAIFLVLCGLFLVLSPERGRELWGGIALMAGIGGVAVLPLVLLLRRGDSPIGPGAAGR